MARTIIADPGPAADGLFAPVTRSAQPRIDALTDDITVHAVADITEHAAALWGALHPRPDIPVKLFDALYRIAAWGISYAKEPLPEHRHFIEDAVTDVGTWINSGGFTVRLAEGRPADPIYRLLDVALRVSGAVQTAVRSAL